MLNWQLGQYFEIAYIEALGSAFGKKLNVYPKEPMFSKNLDEPSNSEALSKSQEELETLKFQEFFNNLGNHVAIKKKGR